jgi:DNA-binding NarL/FixJ family response regulator
MNRDLTQLRTVVVDDSDAFLMRLRLALRKIPHVEIVGFAASAAEAIGLLDRTKPDLVLLDLYLKESSGIDVLRHIFENGLKVKTLVMTSEQSQELCSACLLLGASRFCDKAALIGALPQEIEALARKVSAATSTS